MQYSKDCFDFLRREVTSIGRRRVSLYLIFMKLDRILQKKFSFLLGDMTRQQVNYS